MRPEIISSLITGGSDGGGEQTNESIMSSVTRIIPTRSGGSVRDDLFVCKNNSKLQINWSSGGKSNKLNAVVEYIYIYFFYII